MIITSDESNTFNATFGAAIRRWRLAHGWTQAVLAVRASISPNYVARLERGELGCSLFVASRMAYALGRRVDDLIVPVETVKKPGPAMTATTKGRRARAA